MLFSHDGSFRLTHVLLILVVLTTTAVFADDDDKQPDTAGEVNAQPAIVIDEKTQRTVGLQTTPLQSSQFHTEFAVTGKAITVQPLLALRNRYLALANEHNQLLAKLKQAEQNKQRQQDLYRHGVTSMRNLQEQQLQWQTDKAQVDANTFQSKAIIDEARLAWGTKLAAWTLSTDANRLAGFLSGQDVLLQISLPADRHLSHDMNVIYVESSGHRDKASKARLISEAPQTDTALPGQSYFFQGQGRFIKPGMRVVAWIPEKKQVLPGVMIPKSAVIWLLDQVVVYVKTGKDKFNRRIVTDYTVSPEGYFTAMGFEADEEIVTTGAQMLLSEEQRRQIPDEDD